MARTTFSVAVAEREGENQTMNTISYRCPIPLCQYVESISGPYHEVAYRRLGKHILTHSLEEKINYLLLTSFEYWHVGITEIPYRDESRQCPRCGAPTDYHDIGETFYCNHCANKNAIPPLHDVVRSPK